jgi:hypothetical protein
VNEERLKISRIHTKDASREPSTSKSSECEKLPTYVFEKVKHETIPQFVKCNTHALSEKDERETFSSEYILESLPSEIRPRTFSMPARNTCTKPIIRKNQRSHLNLNIDKPLIAEVKNKTGAHKPTAPCELDIFFEEEMRTRTSSMPTTSLCNKPRIQHLRHSHQNLFARPELEIHTVRSFELDNKGKIIKRSESKSTRSSTSELSFDDDFFLSKNTSRMSSVEVAEGYNVYVKGIEGVGKTALMQQFLTTQYLGGFDTVNGKCFVM